VSTPPTTVVLFLPLLLLFGGCTGAAKPMTAASVPTVPAAAFAIAKTESSHTEGGEALPWMHNAPTAALAAARERAVPVFVAFGATWCHTCVHMHAVTLRDPSLALVAGRAVWLDIDIDLEANAEFVAKYHPEAYPTWMMLAPDGRVLGHTEGSMVAAEVTSFVHRAYASGLQPGAAEAAVDAAHAKLNAEAAADQRAAPSWIALRAVTGRAAAAAEQGPAHDTGQIRQELAAAIEQALRASVDVRRPYADDISSAFDTLIELSAPVDKPALAGRWAEYLEAMAASATSADERRAYDPHLLLAYLALGGDAPRKAVAMLQRSAREVPTDFNPHVRLARAYGALHAYPDAFRACDAAMQKVYGPRTLRTSVTCADIGQAARDTAREARYLQQGLRVTESMSLSAAGATLRTATALRYSKLAPAATFDRSAH
jgi:thioredoxin-like negative regulator of GroEL